MKARFSSSVDHFREHLSISRRSIGKDIYSLSCSCICSCTMKMYYMYLAIIAPNNISFVFCLISALKEKYRSSKSKKFHFKLHLLVDVRFCPFLCSWITPDGLVQRLVDAFLVEKDHWMLVVIFCCVCLFPSLLLQLQRINDEQKTQIRKTERALLAAEVCLCLLVFGSGVFLVIFSHYFFCPFFFTNFFKIIYRKRWWKQN